MTLSFEFEVRFDLMIKQAKESVFTEIDVRANTLRRIFQTELSRQREELLETINTVTGKQKPEQVVLKCEPSPWTDSRRQNNLDVSCQSQANDTTNYDGHTINDTSNSSTIDMPINSQLNNQQQQSYPATSIEVPDSFSINSQPQFEANVPVKEECLETDLNDDCNCVDCQSSSEQSVPETDDEVILLGDTDELPVRKKQKNNNHPSQSTTAHSPQAGPSWSTTRNHGVPSTFKVISLDCSMANCKAKFPNKVNFDAHMAAEHQIKSFPCLLPSCYQSFDTMRQLLEHRRLEHDGAFKLKCGYCGHTETHQQAFITHLHNTHYVGVFQCVECTFIGLNRTIVTGHYRQYHANTTCTHPGCGKMFENYSLLKRHERVHSQVRPYHCKWPACSHAAHTLDNLKKHIRGVHYEIRISVKELKERGIVDPDLMQYVEIVKELL